MKKKQKCVDLELACHCWEYSGDGYCLADKGLYEVCKNSRSCDNCGSWVFSG